MEQNTNLQTGQKLFLTIRNREEVLFEGAIKALSSWNQSGKFDVLPLHANFIALIEKGLTIHELSGSKKDMKFNLAILQVSQNKVDIYLGVQKLLPEETQRS